MKIKNDSGANWESKNEEAIGGVQDKESMGAENHCLKTEKRGSW